MVELQCNICCIDLNAYCGKGYSDIISYKIVMSCLESASHPLPGMFQAVPQSGLDCGHDVGGSLRRRGSEMVAVADGW